MEGEVTMQLLHDGLARKANIKIPSTSISAYPLQFKLRKQVCAELQLSLQPLLVGSTSWITMYKGL